LVHPIFRFWFFVTFGNEYTKILHDICLRFARKDGQDGKKREKNHATKVTKIPKTKGQKYGMNETKVVNVSEFELHVIQCLMIAIVFKLFYL
jgi:hypothetical protein